MTAKSVWEWLQSLLKITGFLQILQDFDPGFMISANF